MIMKYLYVKQALEDKGLKITKEEAGQAVNIVHLGNYIRLFMYHYEEDVYEIELVAHMNIDDDQHYQDIMTAIDTSLNMLSTYSKKQRVALYEFIDIGSIDTKLIDLADVRIQYELKDGYIRFVVLERTLNS